MIMSESALPAATLEQWTAAVQSQQETARGFARAVADALTVRVPSAAYLVFRTDADLDADLDDNLFLDSIRGADGSVLTDFGDPAATAVLAGLTTIVGGTNGEEAWALLHAMRRLRAAGGVFDLLPDHLIDPDRDEEGGAPCLILAPSGFPQHWDWDSGDPTEGFGVRLLRPYCAPRSDDRTTAPAEAVGDECVTLTVVVRQPGVEGDHCGVLLGEHPDVLFVGHQDGVTLTACALGAEPGSWP
jgi:hypothetical protein